MAISLKVRNTLICVFCPQSPETLPNVARPFFKVTVTLQKRLEVTALEDIQEQGTWKRHCARSITTAIAIFLL
jgi:hypothetical protein